MCFLDAMDVVLGDGNIPLESRPGYENFPTKLEESLTTVRLFLAFV